MRTHIKDVCCHFGCVLVCHKFIYTIYFQISPAVNKAKIYLEGAYVKERSPYTLSIVAYALKLIGSTEAGNSLTKLNSMKITKGMSHITHLRKLLFNPFMYGRHILIKYVTNFVCAIYLCYFQV